MRRAMRHAVLGLAVAMSVGGLIEPVTAQSLSSTSANAPKTESKVQLSPAQSRWLECSIELAFLADPATFPFPLKARYVDGRLEVGGKVNSEAARLRAVQLAADLAKFSVTDRIHLEDLKRPTSVAMTPAQLTETAAKLLFNHLAEDVNGLEVTTKDGTVIVIHGQASSMEDKLSASQYLRDLPGCKAVQNQLTLTRVSLHGKMLNRVSRDGLLTVTVDGSAEPEPAASHGKIVQVGGVKPGAGPEEVKAPASTKPPPSPTKVSTQPEARKGDPNKTATAKAAPKAKPVPGMLAKTTWTVLGEEPKETPKGIATAPVVPSPTSVSEMKAPGVVPAAMKPDATIQKATRTIVTKPTTPTLDKAPVGTTLVETNTPSASPEPKKTTLQLTRFEDGKSTPAPASTVEQLPLKEPTGVTVNSVPNAMNPTPSLAIPQEGEPHPKPPCCCNRPGGFWNQLFPFGISCKAVPVDTKPAQNTSSYGGGPRVAAPVVAKTNPVVLTKATVTESPTITPQPKETIKTVTKTEIPVINTKPADKGVMVTKVEIPVISTQSPDKGVMVAKADIPVINTILPDAVVMVTKTSPTPSAKPVGPLVTEGRIIFEAEPFGTPRESSVVSQGKIIFEPEKIVTAKETLQASRRNLKQTIQRLVVGYAHNIDVIGSQGHGMVVQMTVSNQETEHMIREKLMQLPEMSASDVRLEIKIADY